MKLEKILENLKGHKVTLTYTPHGEAQLRETSGILKNSSPNIIHLKLINDFGEESNYYLNRHGCVLHSVIDEGKV